MNIVNLLLVLMYILFFSIMIYIIYNNDCKLSIYFIWIIMLISCIKLIVILNYSNLCNMAKSLYCCNNLNN